MKIIGFLLLLFWGLLGYAQEELITIQKAVDLGCRNNEELNSLYTQLNQKNNFMHNGIGVSPLKISYLKEGIAQNKKLGCSEKRFTISQEFEFPLSTIYRLKALNQEEKIKVYKYIYKTLEIKANIKEKYVDVLCYSYHNKLMNKKYKLIFDLHKMALSKLKVGKSKEREILTIELLLIAAEDSMRLSEAKRQKAMLELCKEIGIPVDQSENYVISDTLNNLCTFSASQVQSALMSYYHPLNQALKNELKASDYLFKQAKSQLIPSIDISLYKQNYGSGFDYTGFEIGLSFPGLFKYKEDINLAEKRKNEILRKQEEVRIAIKTQIEDSWHGYSECFMAMENYKSLTKNKIFQLHQIALQDLKNTKIDLYNYLEVLNLYFEQEVQYLKLLHNSYNHLISLEKFIENELIY